MQHLWQQLLNNLGGVEALEGEAVGKILEAKGRPMAVACSGGPDSVAVALVTRALHEGHLTLLHFNHRLRGVESDADEAFVRDLAKKLNAEFRCGSWENPDAKNETAAREARMGFLHSYEYPQIVFGQHADDVAETLLMRLARGANLQGLTAPHAVSKVGAHEHLRPLLPLRKGKILEALEGLGIPYRTDASNGGSDYLRNRIRNELLPLWQKLETRDVVEGILASQRQLKTMLPHWRKTTEPYLLKQKAKEAADAHKPFAARLPIGATVFLPDGAWVSAQRVKMSCAQAKASSKPMEVVYISADFGTSGFLALMSWRDGARYRPLGTGSRKIKELLGENAKTLPATTRRNFPVIYSADAVTPLWLPSCRITAQAALPEDAIDAIELRFCTQPPSLNEDDT